ncbi:MAG: phosphate ABC transporter permease subunit PstC [Gammaproteobacteria bacterium]|nr:phosphate ABC transporter permease subunit PstC [Gammaproteobacteria bacterium]
MFARQRRFDKLYLALTTFSAWFVLFIFIAMLFILVKGSLPAWHAFGLHFFTQSTWNPVTEQFGALGPIVGTLITSLIALLIGVPVSFGIAVFLTAIAPQWLRQPLRIAIELLAGIPSIIYGMWGLFIFAPFFSTHVEQQLSNHLSNIPLIGVLFSGAPMGIDVLTAGIILGIMIIPFMASVMRDVFEIVPDILKESAYALGATTWEVIWRIVLPYARVGVSGGIMLGLGRALGETMAVAFVIGNSHILSASLLQPGTTISAVLANEFTEAVSPTYLSALIELGLILFMITVVVIVLSKYLLRRLSQQVR